MRSDEVIGESMAIVIIIMSKDNVNLIVPIDF